jgi:hypothetical protein
VLWWCGGVFVGCVCFFADPSCFHVVHIDCMVSFVLSVPTSRCDGCLHIDCIHPRTNNTLRQICKTSQPARPVP